MARLPGSIPGPLTRPRRTPALAETSRAAVGPCVHDHVRPAAVIPWQPGGVLWQDAVAKPTPPLDVPCPYPRAGRRASGRPCSQGTGIAAPGLRGFTRGAPGETGSTLTGAPLGPIRSITWAIQTTIALRCCEPCASTTTTGTAVRRRTLCEERGRHSAGDRHHVIQDSLAEPEQTDFRHPA